MLNPIRIYKRSKKATAISIISALISLLLILAPVIVTVKIRTLNPLLFLLYAVCFTMAVFIFTGSEKAANQIAERDLPEHQTSC